MVIEFHCSNCGKSLSTSEDKAGRQARCPECGEPIRVPYPKAEPDLDGANEPFNGALSPPVPVGRPTTCKMCGAEVPAGENDCPECGEPVIGEWTKPELQSGYKIEISQVLDESWKVFQAQMGMSIALTVVFLLLNILVQMPMQVVVQLMQQGNAGGELLLLYWVFWLVNYVGQTFLIVGVWKAFLKIARGQTAELGDLVAGGPQLLSMLGNSIVFSLMVFGGMVLCVIPGLFVLAAFWPYSLLVVDRKLPGIEPLRQAFVITRGNRWTSVGLGVIVFFIVLGGLLALCVGLLFALPYAYLISTVAYLHMTGEPTKAGLRRTQDA